MKSAMNRIRMYSAVCSALLCVAGIGMAQAQTTGTEVQRDVNQQKRIEQGLKSGELTTKEAARLEQGEARIDREQARALKDGTLSPAEKTKIQADQNRESAEIRKLKTNDRTGNPNSVSSQRMQADVQRNINQQQRIEGGIKDGSLTRREVGSLERGQANVDRKEARAGRDGHVGAKEEARIQAAENHQSKRIHKEKHDAEGHK